MSLITKILLVLLAIIIIIAQFFQPEKNKGDVETLKPFIAYTNPPKEVMGILENHCFDCHSDVTNYPWYSNITPVNFWMADHIKDGKKHFDVSQWEGYSLKKQDHKFEELIEMVEAKEMPLKSYTYSHRDADLAEKQIHAVVAWAEQVRLKINMEKKPQ